LFYADYFAYIARSGIERSKSLYGGIATGVALDVSTVPLKGNYDLAQNNLVRAFDIGYETLWQEGSNLSPMQNAFQGLAAWIRAKEGQTINEYLTDEGIAVYVTYAHLASIFGQDIDDSNTKEDP